MNKTALILSLLSLLLLFACSIPNSTLQTDNNQIGSHNSKQDINIKSGDDLTEELINLDENIIKMSEKEQQDENVISNDVIKIDDRLGSLESYKKSNGEMWANTIVEQLKYNQNLYSSDQVFFAFKYCDENFTVSKDVCINLLAHRDSILKHVRISRQELDSYLSNK